MRAGLDKNGIEGERFTLGRFGKWPKGSFGSLYLCSLSPARVWPRQRCKPCGFVGLVVLLSLLPLARPLCNVVNPAPARVSLPNNLFALSAAL